MKSGGWCAIRNRISQINLPPQQGGMVCFASLSTHSFQEPEPWGRCLGVNNPPQTTAKKRYRMKYREKKTVRYSFSSSRVNDLPSCSNTVEGIIQQQKKHPYHAFHISSESPRWKLVVAAARLTGVKQMRPFKEIDSTVRGKQRNRAGKMKPIFCFLCKTQTATTLNTHGSVG